MPKAAGEEHQAEKAEREVALPEIVRLEMSQIVQAQDKQPMMAAVKAYIRDGIMPRDKLTRIRALEQAQMYEVNQAGALCKVRERGNKGSLGLDLQVVIPEGPHIET